MENKKRIICFIDSLGSGGAQRQLVGLAIMLKQKGYDVKVCYYHDFPFYTGLLDSNNVTHELIPGAANSLQRVAIIKRYFKQEAPDWVIAYQETPSLIASLIKMLGCKIQLIVSERNTSQKITYREHLRFFLYRWADFIVPNSYSQETILKKYKPKLSAKIKVITNFIDLNRFEYHYHKRHDIPKILVVGRVWPQKNTINFIKSAKILRERGVSFSIKWYGLTESVTQYAETCKRLIEEYDLKDVLELLPKTNDIAMKYSENDFFCLPSLYEGTPNVIGEAMASGLPVACGKVCDNHIYVKNGVNGVLFNPLEVDSIADGLQSMLEVSEDEYDSYCKQSRCLAEELFAPEKFFEKYESLILKQW